MATEILVAIMSTSATIIGAIITVHRPIKRRVRLLLIGLVSLALIISIGLLIYIWSLPSPQAHIISPDENRDQNVPSILEVIVDYKDIPTFPESHYLWVVVGIPGVKPMISSGLGRLVYPQIQDGKIPLNITGSGRYKTTVVLGEPLDSGYPFNIMVLMVDAKFNNILIIYSENCIRTGACGGIQLPNSGVQILDFVTVLRM